MYVFARNQSSLIYGDIYISDILFLHEKNIADLSRPHQFQTITHALLFVSGLIFVFYTSFNDVINVCVFYTFPAGLCCITDCMVWVESLTVSHGCLVARLGDKALLSNTVVKLSTYLQLNHLDYG